MSDNVRKNMNNHDLDDDDENGSKAEDGDYEEVKPFDEESDLLQTTKPDRSQMGVNGVVVGEVPVSHAVAVTPNEQEYDPAYDSPEALGNVDRIVSIPWPAAAGKRPPRDMKRLDQNEWYVVCKVMKWGDTPALFVRGTKNSSDDYGFYKPPAQYYTYHFQVGDRVRLSQVGYSSSRNKVATSIRVKVTHMFPVPEDKRTWIPPPVDEAGPPAEAKSKKRDKGGGSDGPASGKSKKNKKMKETQLTVETSPLEFPKKIESPLQGDMGAANAKNQANKPPFFVHTGSFGPGAIGLGQSQGASGIFFPSTPDINRAPSFSGIFPHGMSSSDLFGGSSANLLQPSSPTLLGSNSPILGSTANRQPSMQRIHSIAGFGSFSSVSSPTTNHPPLANASFYFGSTANMGFPNQGESNS